LVSIGISTHQLRVFISCRVSKIDNVSDIHCGETRAQVLPRYLFKKKYYNDGNPIHNLGEDSLYKYTYISCHE